MKCEICGKEIEQSAYYEWTLCSSECFTARYWLEKYKEYCSKNSPVIVYKGNCYTLGEPNARECDRGYYGRTFKITPHQRLTPYMTNNLWSNGPIPPAFRELMPDNIFKLEAL